MAEARSSLPSGVERMRDRIEQWRATRRGKTSPMPEELWEKAAGLARAHGVYRVSRALGVSYESLRWRAERIGQSPCGDGQASGFIELTMAELVQPQSRRAVVELSSGDGSRMVVELSGHGEVDVQGLAETFLRQRS